MHYVQPKSAQVAPRSDNVSEQKKEEGTTKKEFLKFDDSNMSDIQNVSKKKDEVCNSRSKIKNHRSKF